MSHIDTRFIERAYDGAAARNEDLEIRLNEAREWLDLIWRRSRYSSESQVLHVPLTREEMERLGQAVQP